MGFQKVAFLSVHVAQRSAVGQRHFPQRGKCYQCGAEEKGVITFLEQCSTNKSNFLANDVFWNLVYFGFDV